MKEKAKIELTYDEDNRIKTSVHGNGQVLVIMTCALINHLAKLFDCECDQLINILSGICKRDDFEINEKSDRVDKMINNIIKWL